jgi:hypothetical protein
MLITWFFIILLYYLQTPLSFDDKDTRACGSPFSPLSFQSGMNRED